MSAHMTCQEMVDFLMAYLDGELPGDERERFEVHLRDCPPCEVYLDTYRKTVELGQSVCKGEGPDAPVPEDVPEALVAAILAARRTS